MEIPSSLTTKIFDSETIRKKSLNLRGGFIPWLGIIAAVLLFGLTVTASAQTGSTISATSGPVSWDFGPVVAGTVTNVGIQDTCPPGLCDNHDLTVTLPAPAATFYQTNTVQLTLKYTWTSTAPTDLDIPECRGSWSRLAGRHFDGFRRRRPDADRSRGWGLAHPLSRCNRAAPDRRSPCRHDDRFPASNHRAASTASPRGARLCKLCRSRKHSALSRLNHRRPTWCG